MLAYLKGQYSWIEPDKHTLAFIHNTHALPHEVVRAVPVAPICISHSAAASCVAGGEQQLLQRRLSPERRLSVLAMASAGEFSSCSCCLCFALPDAERVFTVGFL